MSTRGGLTAASIFCILNSTVKGIIMSAIQAAEIKRRGVSAFAPALEEDGTAIITVRGSERYVVMTIEKYHALRESELAQAVREARADYKAGRITDRTIAGHLRRVTDET